MREVDNEPGVLKNVMELAVEKETVLCTESWVRTIGMVRNG
jgi:hypothetical protein